MLKKISFILCLVLIISIKSSVSQEADTSVVEKTPVTDAFACSMLIESQTINQPTKKSKEFIIHHRIGTIKSLSDLFGVFGPANARLGFNYGISDKIMIGFGTEKYNKMQEINWKYSILHQKTNGTPFFLSYFGNVVVSGREKAYFGDNYKFVDRLSYFHQLIIARKFSERISFEIAPYFLHFNKVDSLYSNEAIGVSVGGRCKIWNEISFMAEFNYVSPLESFTYPKNLEGNDVPGAPKPGYAFGLEKNGGTHAFQLFATTYNNIIAQKNYLYNLRDFNSLLIGFNITVRF
ncbi:MAG: hypothetical protein A2X08_02420 [Bacteroidetes bacterium GWA2_32_17]|nr:MAG: hypothetical protein A2X08_02420 [Bacteroidetes bacterium GWA2_32_17]